MTLKEIELRLAEAGCDSPREDACILAEHFLKVSRASLILMTGELPSSRELEMAVERRASREPLQYILGKWYFMNECYEVDPTVLIPRPDTEILVEYGINNIPKGGHFADLCTGSGCVAVSTLAARNDTTCIAVEKFENTLNTARRNARLNGVSDRLEFVLGDVTLPIFDKDKKFDAILTNPPYVTTSEYSSLEKEVYSEPRAALTDEGDGLSIIGKIIEIYKHHLKNDGFIAIEIGCNQGVAVSAIAEENGFFCEILKDYSARDRVCVLRLNKNLREGI